MKTEIKIAVADKAQAMQYKGILEALGEELSRFYYCDGSPHERQNVLAYDVYNGWICTRENYVSSRREITIAQLVEMLTKPKQQVVKITSQVEYTTLMREYIAKGWKWLDGTTPNTVRKHFNFPVYAEYSDNFVLTSTSGDKEVIGFESLNLKAPDHIAEDGMPLWFRDKFWAVYYDRSEGWKYDEHRSGSFILNLGSPMKDPNTKIFSTKNAAIEWESAHCKVLMSEDGYALCYGDTYIGTVIDDNGRSCYIGDFVLGKGSGVITDPEVYKAFKTKRAAKAWIEKQNSPVLLTTDDGVRLREGDKVYRVKRLPYAKELTAHADRVETGVIHLGYWFSTLEAANTYIAKQNPVLLTTEDGVDLREGDRWYPAYKGEKGWYVGCNTFVMYTDSRSIVDPSSERVVFSTKEAAEAWVEKQNSPVLLTTEDGIAIKQGHSYFKVRISDNTIHPVGALKSHHKVIKKPNMFKAFSTKEAAEAWVKKNIFSAISDLPRYVVEQMRNALGVPKVPTKTIKYKGDGGYANITKERVTFFVDNNPEGIFIDAKDLIEIYKLHSSI